MESLEEAALNVTPDSTISTLQTSSEAANAVINAILIALIISLINSIVSKIVYLTHKNRFSYISFLRVYIFHNSDSIAHLFKWFYQSWCCCFGLRRSPYKVARRRLVKPLLARLIIFLFTIGSIVVGIPQDRRLKGCDRGDWVPTILQKEVIGPPRVRSNRGPVCFELPLETDLGIVRSHANYCSVPVIGNLDANPLFGEFREQDLSAIIVRYFEDTGVLYTGVASLKLVGTQEQFALQGIEAYVEWIDEQNRNFRSMLHNWKWDEHAKVVLDGIKFKDAGCEITGDRTVIEGGFQVIPVGCRFDPVSVASVVDAFVRNSLVWGRSNVVLQRIHIQEDNFQGVPPKVRYCPIDITVQRPILNMAPLAAALLFLFTFHLAVNFTTTEKGEVMDQTFDLVKEVLGHDCKCGPIETNDDGIQVAEVKKWVCTGGVACHKGILKGDGCDEVPGFPEDFVETRCRYADGSGKRVVHVYREETKKRKRY